LAGCLALCVPPDLPQTSRTTLIYPCLQIVNVLATLGEYPLIRYYHPPSGFHHVLGPGAAVGEHIGKRLADRVQAEIDAYARDNSNFPVRPPPPSLPRLFRSCRG